MRQSRTALVVVACRPLELAQDWGEEMGQSREQLWEMVGGVHVGREESAVCIRSPEPIAQTTRGEREASQPQGVVTKQSYVMRRGMLRRASSYLCMRSPEIEFSPPGILRHR